MEKTYRFQQRLLNEYFLNLPKNKIIANIKDVISSRVDKRVINKLKFKIIKEIGDSESGDEYGATLFTVVASGKENDIKLFKKQFKI